MALTLNSFQLISRLAPQPWKFLNIGRGAGKSTDLALEIRDLVVNMPRMAGTIVGETYIQILTRTLPSTIQGLESIGLKKGYHYSVGRQLKIKGINVPEPFQPPLDYKHFIHFWNGAGFHLVSQDRPGSGRGLNTDFVLGDEATLLDYEKLYNDVILTNRANEGKYKYHKHHGSTFAFTHALTPKGKWVYEFEEKALLKPKEYIYIQASALVNKHNLPANYFTLLKDGMSEELYNIEVLNIKPLTIKDGFYSNLNDKHFYTNYKYNRIDDKYNLDTYKDVSLNCLDDGDCDPSLPLIISIDWGAHINSMVICQAYKNEFRVIKSMFVKSPRIVQDLIIDEFIPYYAAHSNRDIFFHYDPSGSNKLPNSHKTLYEECRDLLIKQGWNVYDKKKHNKNINHTKKYNLIQLLLQEKDNRLPIIRINKNNCKELIISMQNARTKQGATSLFEKDKRAEGNKSARQEHTTHLSDAFDIPIYNMYEHLLQSNGGQFIDIMLLGQ